MIDLAIVVVAYNSAADLPQLLASIPAAAGALSWHVVVVDNSAATSTSLAETCGRPERVSFVDAGSNLGYSGGLNLGLQLVSPSRFTVFLNPDLTLQAHALEHLVEACVGTEADVGAAASVPLVLDAHGRPQPSLRREPTTLRSLGEALCGDHWPGRPHWLAEMVRSPEDYARARPVEWATGAALLVRTNVVTLIGPWDSARFFLYSEETDYARRIRDRGYTIAFAPTAVVRHRGAASGSGPALDALLAVNKVRYFRKWHGRPASALFFGVAVVHSLIRLRRPESRLTLRALFSAPARAALPGGGA
ncbi:glycosyltransferase family 2 protein [Cryobacterium frigoriphilum]|uniref:Glycosyltransferase family 2 protein n=1 Tax=Cryobacterium frigoriphilum TaxID=1259150 RepID=A0A4V3IRM2_9MICO|nr:glycosyltransferase family 2 protein [Cryobacterium frigoriphilum]TFD52131.1 glycosyltransferase family 2 protein [Cryobacterium frigoriphilum]